MSIFKRFLAILISLILMLCTFAACKDTDTSSEPDSSSPTASVSEPEVSKPDESETVDTNSTVSEKEDVSSVPVQSSPVSSAPSTPSSTPIPSDTPVSNKTPDQLILGKWIALVDVAPLLTDFDFDPNKSLCVAYYAEFTNFGTMIVTVSEGSLFQLMYQAFNTMVDKELENSMMTHKEFEDQFLAEYGMTPWDFFQSAAKELAEIMSDVSKYKFEGDTLYLSPSNTSEYTAVDYSFYNDDVLYIIQEGEKIEFSRS